MIDLWMQPLDTACLSHLPTAPDNDAEASCDVLECSVLLEPGCCGMRTHARRQLNGVLSPFLLLDVSFFAQSDLLSGLQDALPTFSCFGQSYSLVSGTFHRFGHFTAAIRVTPPEAEHAGWYYYDGLSASMKWLSNLDDPPHTPAYHTLSYLIYAKD